MNIKASPRKRETIIPPECVHPAGGIEYEHLEADSQYESYIYTGKRKVLIDAGIATSAMFPKRAGKSKTQSRSKLPSKHCWYVQRVKPGIYTVQRYTDERTEKERYEECKKEWDKEQGNSVDPFDELLKTVTEVEFDPAAFKKKVIGDIDYLCWCAKSGVETARGSEPVHKMDEEDLEKIMALAAQMTQVVQSARIHRGRAHLRLVK